MVDPELKKDVRFLTSRLGAIIREQAGQPTFDTIERLRCLSRHVRAQHDAPSIAAKRRLVGSLTAAKACEVTHAFSLFFQLVNLCEERARVRSLRANPAPRQSVRALFAALREQGVTPATLQKVLDELEIEPVLTAHPTEGKRRTLLQQLIRLAHSFDQPDEALEALWQTEEVRARRVTPLDEVATVLFFFDRTILAAAARCHREFVQQLAEHYPTVHLKRPFLRFGSWVGGDRDGHPFVTPEVSIRTAAQHANLATRELVQSLDQLVGEISHSARTEDEGDDAFHPRETYRRRIAALRDRVARGNAAPDECMADIVDIQKRLRAQKAPRAAGGHLEETRNQVAAFGLHLAHLDVREHSTLIHNQPDTVRNELRAIRAIQKAHGEAAAHRFIISMTHSADDVLALLALAHEVDLPALDLIPLFETTADLDRAPALLARLWGTPTYRAHLRKRGDIQEVMLGYSDSNKDAGYIAANWFLYDAQRNIAELADRHGIKIRFFHGKGGTIDRGGGMSHRSLLAQPHACHGGRLRITEQGEVISLKYANPEIAQRNLEQLTTAVLYACCLRKEDDQAPVEWEHAMRELALSSQAAYQDLVYRTPTFADYFQHATPIDLIEHIRIGSRPSRRSATRDVRELRAIPWVFAWTQSRHLLPAWYGMGHALEAFARADHGLNLLRTMHASWPFFRMIMENAEASLAKTDLYIASRYAALVPSANVRKEIFGRISDEHARSVSMVKAITGQSKLLEHQPRLAESIRLRNPYVDPLHYIQVRFLATWRRTAESNRTEDMRRLLALTVNGIASGMKSTG